MIFPNPESCLRLARALAVEMHENWLEAMRHLNMDHLREHKKQMLRPRHERPGLPNDRAVLAALNAASRRLWRWPWPALTAAVRGAPRKSGRGGETPFNRTYVDGPRASTFLL